VPIVFHLKFGIEGELVRWNTSGSLFVVQSQATIDIYSTVSAHYVSKSGLVDVLFQQMSLLHTVTHPSRLHDVKFCQRVNGTGELLLAGAEDKKLSVYQIPEDHESTDPPTIIAEMVGHSNRVKAVETLSVALPESLTSKRTSTTIVCTISSDGKIFVYDLASLPEPSSSPSKIEMTPNAEYDTKGTRLTCVTVAEGEIATAPENGKRKRTLTEDDGEDSDAEDEEGWSFGAQADDVEKDEGEEVADGSASEN
jgi:protein MAK11